MISIRNGTDVWQFYKDKNSYKHFHLAPDYDGHYADHWIGGVAVDYFTNLGADAKSIKQHSGAITIDGIVCPTTVLDVPAFKTSQGA